MILVGPIVTLLVCAAAFWKGGRAERCASLAIVFALVADTIGQLLIGWGSVLPLIAADLLLGVGFVTCAALHAQRWLYAEVGLVAALLLVHGFSLDGEAMLFSYRAAVDAIDLLITGVLAWATWRQAKRSR